MTTSYPPNSVVYCKRCPGFWSTTGVEDSLRNHADLESKLFIRLDFLEVIKIRDRSYLATDQLGEMNLYRKYWCANGAHWDSDDFFAFYPRAIHLCGKCRAGFYDLSQAESCCGSAQGLDASEQEESDVPKMPLEMRDQLTADNKIAQQKQFDALRAILRQVEHHAGVAAADLLKLTVREDGGATIEIEEKSDEEALEEVHEEVHDLKDDPSAGELDDAGETLA